MTLYVDERVYRDFPWHVSKYYRSMVRAQSPIARHTQLLHLAEQVVVALASFSLSVYRNSRLTDPDTAVEQLLYEWDAANRSHKLTFGMYVDLWTRSDTAEGSKSPLLSEKHDGYIGRFLTFVARARKMSDHEVDDYLALIGDVQAGNAKSASLKQYVDALIEYRNSVAHTGADKVPQTDEQYCRAINSLLERSLLQLLRSPSVEHRLLDFPVGTLHQTQGTVCQVSGEYQGVYFLADVDPGVHLDEKWNSPSWKLPPRRADGVLPSETSTGNKSEPMGELLLQRQGNGGYTIEGLYHYLANGAPPPLRGDHLSGSWVASAKWFNKKRFRSAEASLIAGDFARVKSPSGTGLRIPLFVDRQSSVSVSCKASDELTLAARGAETPFLDWASDALKVAAEHLVDYGPLDITIEQYEPGASPVGEAAAAAVATLRATLAAYPHLDGEQADILARAASDASVALTHRLDAVEGWAHDRGGVADAATGQLLHEFDWAPVWQLLLVRYNKPRAITPGTAAATWTTDQAVDEVVTAVARRDPATLFRLAVARSHTLIDTYAPSLRDTVAGELVRELRLRNDQDAALIVCSGDCAGVLVESRDRANKIEDRLGWDWRGEVVPASLLPFGR